MILLVRAAPQLPRTVMAFEAAGLAVVPLAISTVTVTPPVLDSMTPTLVVTSANAAGPWVKGRRVIAVGEGTAAACTDQGAEVVYHGERGAEGLLPYLATLPPQPLLHLRGQQVAAAWYGRAAALGHRIEHHVVYTTTYAEELPAAVTAALRGGGLGHVVLFSAGGTRHLQHLLQQATITPTQTAVAFSPQVATAATAFPKVVVAAKPSLHAAITTLKNELAR
ncbi:MAG: uroporphyrinogen-III synthase [Pseudomonadaceae bacterium]|nr:uroporphyrinogen-III synthase [Pseudomonadaceae bacterium]